MTTEIPAWRWVFSDDDGVEWWWEEILSSSLQCQWRTDANKAPLKLINTIYAYDVWGFKDSSCKTSNYTKEHICISPDPLRQWFTPCTRCAWIRYTTLIPADRCTSTSFAQMKWFVCSTVACALRTEPWLCVWRQPRSAWGLTCVAKDRVGKPCRWSPIYSSDGSGCRPALAAAASPHSLTPPRVQTLLLLDLLAARTAAGGGCATVGGAPASQAGGRSRGGRGRDRRGGLHHLLQGGALPQRVQTGAAASWGKAGQRSGLVLHAVNDLAKSTWPLVNTDCIWQVSQLDRTNWSWTSACSLHRSVQDKWTFLRLFVWNLLMKHQTAVSRFIQPKLSFKLNLQKLLKITQTECLSCKCDPTGRWSWSTSGWRHLQC